MKIAILGGTGDIGEGLALRWAHDTDHEIRIGSRKAEKATNAADAYREIIAERGADATILGDENARVTEGAEIVVVAAPPEYVTSMTQAVSGALSRNAILVSPAVKLRRDAAGFHRDGSPTHSLTAQVDEIAPPDVAVVGAFHSLAAERLATLDAELGIDTLVVGDDQSAKETVSAIIDEIAGLRALDGGPLANAPAVESLAPLCINIALQNTGLHDLGIRFK